MFAFFFVLHRKNECLTCAHLDFISSSNIEGVRTINLNKVWHQFVIIISLITIVVFIRETDNSSGQTCAKMLSSSDNSCAYKHRQQTN